jgi:hypothetical protein
MVRQEAETLHVAAVVVTTLGRVLWYPTQAKKRLEWGTQRLLLVQGVKAAVS